jgi:TctA family transporter
MDIFDGVLFGMQTLANTKFLWFCLLGVTLGTLIGVLPGIGSFTAITLLFPFTYQLDSISSIIMLAGIYYGAQYGGSISSILLNLPGHPASAVTCIDGYPMCQQGRAPLALFITTISSFVGSLFGIIALIMFTPVIAQIAIKFGSAEYFSLILMGLVASGILVSDNVLKGLVAVILGLLLGTIGVDVNSGVSRFDFGLIDLADGIVLATLAVGLFGVSEIINSASTPIMPIQKRISFSNMFPTKQEWIRSIFPALRGSGVGMIVGALPGVGPAIASFLSYAVEKRFSKYSHQLGSGAIEGIVGPEAANNAAAQTSFIPTLSLGIPGDAIMALMLGALLIQGIQPGPTLITSQPELFWGLAISFIIGNMMLLVLNIPLINIWVSLLRIPYIYLYPAILSFIAIGIFSIRNNQFDVYAVAIIGAVAYLLNLLKFKPAPLLLGFVLGPLLEEHLRRVMIISNGDLSVFVTRPISAVILVLTGCILIFTVIPLRNNVNNSPV